MYIAKLQLKNYKSFNTSNELSFGPGFNIILGRNNIGKTALIEALGLQFQNKPHRSLKTIPKKGMPSYGISSLNIAFQLNAGEAEQLLINAAGGFFVPIITDTSLDFSETHFLEILQQPNLLQCVFQQSSFQSAYFKALGNITQYTNMLQISINVAEHKLMSNSPSIFERDSVPLYGIQLAT